MYFHLYLLLTILICLCSRYSLVEIKPELQRNILKFGYGINYKYEGMLVHSFDRFYVITKLVLQTLDNLKLFPIKYDKECKHLRNLDDEDDDRIKQNIKDLQSGKTLKDELVAPKDKDHMTNKSGIIYRFKCDRLECDEEYIGETARTFGERFKEHLKAPSPIHDHNNTTGHTTNIYNFSIVGRKEQNLSRLIKESMFIRVNYSSLNKNIGKYHLPHVWDEVLTNNIELKLK